VSASPFVFLVPSMFLMVRGSSSVRVWIRHCFTNVGDMKLSVVPLSTSAWTLV
jgi:hypothetical protein